MPKYLALTPQQAAEVKQFGAEPSEYVYEVDTGEAVPKVEVPTTWTEEIGAGLKSILPGVADAVLSPLSLAGQTADLIRQGTGTYDPNDPSGLTTLAKSAKEGIVDLVGAPDPRASWLSTGIGRGAGNLAGIATPSALGRKLTGVAANRLAAGLGGSMMAESTIDREMQQQAEAGVQDPAWTALKGLASGLGGGYLEGKLGAGSLLNNLASPARGLGGRLGRGLVEAGKGGITEGLQQGWENALVTGGLQLGDPNFDPARAALVGGIVQGGGSVALDTLAGKPEAPTEAAVPAGEAPKTGPASLKTGRVKPTATPEDTQGAPTYSPTPGVAEAMLKAGKEWNPPIKTPVDSAFKKLADQNVIVTPEDIHSLYNIWGGKAENAKAVEAASNDIYARNVMNDVQKPKSALDVINAELAVRGKYNETRGNLQAELAKLDKKDADLQKTIAENPAAMGTITVANAELARNAAQRKVYEGLLSELDNQEMLELSANQPKLPTKGMANPVIPAGALPGIGETGVEMPSRVAGPAIPTAGPNKGLLTAPPVEAPQPDIAVPARISPGPAREMGMGQPAAERAILSGQAGVVQPTPEQIQRAKERAILTGQEGEKGSPFGDEVRYSTFGPTPETLRAFADALRVVGSRLTYGLRREKTTTPGFVLSWSNGDEAWHVGRGGTYRKDFGPLPDMYDPSFYAKRNEWIKKYGKLRESWKLPKGAEIELDANNIFIPSGSKSEAEFIASSLPPHPLYVGSSEYRERSKDTEGRTTANWLAAQLPPNSAVAKNLRETFGADIGALKPDEQKVFDVFLDKYNKLKEAKQEGATFDRESPQVRYSGIPVDMHKFVDDLFTSLGLKNLGSPDPLYHLGKSVTSRMATRGPSGGLVKWLFADMTREKQKIANVLMEATEPFREFVNTENGIKWINRASTDETWDDFSGLSKEEIPAAQAYAQWWRDVRELITDRGVYVAVIDPNTGAVTYRPGLELPGYSSWAAGDHIYEMAGDKNREAEWKQAQEDFVEKWKEKFGENSENMAREAIANILGVKGMETGPGGEPLFGPVSLPHGMTLPESWRDKRPADSLNRYIRRVSQHLAWAEKVQYNPAARRVFNIKADPMGNDTSKTDPTTWAEAPEEWAYAVREGKRVRADWALNADENNPPDEPIDFAGDSANMNALLSSFKQASSPNPNLQAFSSAASAALMQAPTGLRDVGMSLVRAAQYAGPSAALWASMDYIANIPAKLAEARRAGAMPGDLLEPEIVANSKAIARGLMKVARKMRSWSGREFLDNTGRVIIYDAVKSVIMEGNGDHLVKEFGPAFTEGLSKEEIADQTAAVLSHRASNVSDAGSLPAGMLPQGGGLSAPLSLMRWSVAQYNTFAEDVVNPMLDGKGELRMKRFLTLVLGSIVGGSVINGLMDDLLKRKPDHLTWGEWLNVYNDPKVDKATKAKEFAYAAASRAQVMGALGWVGDYLVAPAAREIAGGTRWANQTDIQYPAWIVGNQMAQTIGSYYNAVVNKRTDGRDFLDFLLEMGKINQNVRVAHGAIKAMQGEEKKGLRDQGVVERVYGVNSSTGRSAALETGIGPVFRSDPFNFTRQAMGNEDLGKFEGFLEERRRTGNVPSLDEWSQDRRYYQALERLVGAEEAKKRREVDRRMDQEVRKKNREIRRLSR